MKIKIYYGGCNPCCNGINHKQKSQSGKRGVLSVVILVVMESIINVI